MVTTTKLPFALLAAKNLLVLLNIPSDRSSLELLFSRLAENRQCANQEQCKDKRICKQYL